MLPFNTKFGHQLRGFSQDLGIIQKPQLGGYNTDEIPKPKQKNFAKLAYSMAFMNIERQILPKYPVIEFTGAYASSNKY
ncbi:MAG: hypothetical protein R2836_06630 [Chitinophagales bacterium]